MGLREVRGHPASPGAPLPLARATCSASVPWGWSNYTPSAGGLKQQEFPTVWAVGGPGCRGWRIGPLAGAHLPARGGGLAWGTEGALVVPVPASRPVPCWPRLSLAAPQRPRSWHRQAAGWGPNHPTAGGVSIQSIRTCFRWLLRSRRRPHREFLKMPHDPTLAGNFLPTRRLMTRMARSRNTKAEEPKAAGRPAPLSSRAGRASASLSRGAGSTVSRAEPLWGGVTDYSWSLSPSGSVYTAMNSPNRIAELV